MSAYLQGDAEPTTAFTSNVFVRARQAVVVTQLLDPVLVAEFGANGYVVTPELLSIEALDTTGAAVDQAVAERTADDDRELGDKSPYEQSFIQCMRLWETNPDVRPLTFDPALAQAAAELLGVASVRLWQDQALYKEPGGRITDAHQDAPFWPVGNAPMVTAWIPLDGSTIDNGAMSYVPGSHKSGPLQMVNLTRTTDAYDILSDPALDGATPITVEAAKGSVVWHHGFTVHMANPNTTVSVRRVFTVVFLADGYPRTKPWPSFALDRAGVGVGEPMAGEGLPVVWPRAPMPPWPDPPSIVGQPTGPQVGRTIGEPDE